MTLRITDITKSYGDFIILNKISYDFSKPGLYIITGRSGNGKTTLLNILAGYEKADSGTIDIGNTDRFSYMFQNFELIDAFNVEENLSLYSKLCGKDTLSPQQQRYIDTLGLRELLCHLPEELSQGQKQRVGIVRSLCCDANIYLCDEPTEALDEDNANRVIELLVEIAKEKVVILVTHNKKAMQTPGAIVLELRQGKFHEISNNQKHLQPSTTPTVKQTPAFDPHAIQYHVETVIKKKTKIQVRFLWICFLCIFCFALAYGVIFGHTSKTELLNRNCIYIDYEGFTLERKDIKITKIPSFQNENLNGKHFEMQVVPYPETNLSPACLGTCVPKEDGIVINQNMANFYKNKFKINTDQELLGQTIQLNIKNVESSTNFKIQGIVDEDTEAAQLYYNKEDFDTHLKEDAFTYKMVYKTSSLYEVAVNQNNRRSVYEEIAAKKGYEPYNSEYHQWVEKDKTTNSYLPYFVILLVVLLAIQIVYTIYGANNDWKYHRNSLMILLSIGVKEKDLSSFYTRYKSKHMALPLLGVGVLSLVSLLVLPSFPIFLFLIYMLVMYVLSIGCVLYHMKKVKRSSLAIYLKEDKEYQ